MSLVAEQVVQVPAQPPLARQSDQRRDRRGDPAATGPRARARPSCAVGSRSTPSLSAALATASASIRSDLPTRPRALRAPAINFGATRTTRSPRATRNRSNRPDTCRQSSIAHTRSPSSDAPPTSAPLEPRGSTPPPSRCYAARRSRRPPPRSVKLDLCGSAPDHDHAHRPFIDIPLKRTSGGHASVGAVPRSYQVTPVILGPAASDTTR